ncbi:MAG TPA: S9 family peptidase [Bacteroidota bacterium]|nr:S9 family peptidase [Bacteroidota bacterium]
MKRLSILFPLLAIILTSLFTNFALAAGPDRDTTPNPILTLDRIYSSGEFRQDRFGPARWMKDGKSYTTLEKSDAKKGAQDIVKYDAKSGKRELLVAAAKLVPAGDTAQLNIEDYEWSADGSKLLVYTNSARVWRSNTRGDYWVYDLTADKLQKIGAKFPKSQLMFAKFSPDGKKMAYVMQSNLYTEDLATGEIVQLTSDGTKDLVNGTSDWVYEEEFGLRDCFSWSPDGKSIAFWQFDSHDVPMYTLVNYTDSLYPVVKTFQYPKVGFTNSAVRIGVVPAAGGSTVWMNVPGDPRNNYIPRMEWADNSAELFIQHIPRHQNSIDLMICNASTGVAHSIFTDTDSAYVDVVDGVTWIDHGKWFTWESDMDGWRHIYLISRDGKEKKLVTKGDFDLRGVVQVDDKDGWLYYMASPDNATQSYLYRSRLDGSDMERLSPKDEEGSHSYQMSPGAKYAIHTFSNSNTVPVIDLVELPSHKTVRALAANKEYAAKIASLKLPKVEFIKVDIGSGVILDGYVVKPTDFDPAKKYPILYNVYGEVAGTTVNDRWGNTSLWHFMLAQQGYVIASVDNRGTPAPRGRAFRKALYHKIGILSPADQAAAVKAMEAKYSWIDTGRVAIWGWSGGGSSTLNAMFQFPDVYKTGMAVAPVAVQRLYDDVYQERYMGTMDDDSAGLTNGSPITWAKNLKGNLLLVHGTGDDNVHFQGSEKLINELVADNKQFTMFAYPNRSHGIFEGKGTTRHLYGMLTKYLEEHMPAGGK